MEIWLDTINLETIQDAGKTGIIAGVTTNPTILSRSTNLIETLDQLLTAQPGAVAIQVTTDTAEQMIEEGECLHAYSNRIMIKVPVHAEGLVAIKQLTQQGIAVLGTGIFHSTQALLAAQAGAAYVAPYVTHIGELNNSYQTLQEIVDVLRVHGSTTKVMAAALVQKEQVVLSAQMGVQAVTIKDDLYYKLLATHPSLEKFNHIFAADWAQAFGEVSWKDILGDLVLVKARPKL